MFGSAQRHCELNSECLIIHKFRYTHTRNQTHTGTYVNHAQPHCCRYQTSCLPQTDYIAKLIRRTINKVSTTPLLTNFQCEYLFMCNVTNRRHKVILNPYHVKCTYCFNECNFVIPTTTPSTCVQQQAYSKHTLRLPAASG